MRFSLRELLIVLTVACLAVPALLFAGPVVKGIAVTGVGAAMLAAAIHAAIDTGRRRALAVGFLIPAVAYAGMLLLAGSPEHDPYKGKFWTSKVMQQPLAWATADRSYYVDFQGKRTKQPPPAPRGGGGGGFGGGFGGAFAYREIPARDDLMPVAHCLWTLLFGYLGMKYAGWVFPLPRAQVDPPRTEPQDAP